MALGCTDPARSVPLHFRECEITHLPGFTGPDQYLQEPQGAATAHLAPPPHDRPCGCPDEDHCEAGVGDGMGVSV
jgi:hypothetical protein